eukprot:scaffold1615_cov103-Isochrysis_galbana.AAC.4
MTDPPIDDTEAREQDAPGTTDAKHRAPVHGHTGGVPSDKALSDTRSLVGRQPWRWGGWRRGGRRRECQWGGCQTQEGGGEVGGVWLEKGEKARDGEEGANGGAEDLAATHPFVSRFVFGPGSTKPPSLSSPPIWTTTRTPRRPCRQATHRTPQRCPRSTSTSVSSCALISRLKNGSRPMVARPVRRICR